ncbi:MAG: hypothetical protein E7148_07275 [Rikenellaceae bacterium]|nr:hypothetical protein [Rikenellaceae bacterium]
MKKMLFTLWSLVAVFALTGCSDDDKDLTSGDVVHKVGTVYFIADESSQVVPLQNIKTDEFTAWRPDADSWLTLEHLEGNQLIVRVEENFGSVRTSKITVRSGNVIEEIPVYQMEKRSVRFDGLDVVKLRGIGETQDIPLLISNMEPPYTVESEATWVNAVIIDANQPTPDPTPNPDDLTPAPANQPVVGGQSKIIMRLTMEENVPGAGERTATLTVKGFSSSGSEVSYKISVSQAATYRKNLSFSIPEFTDSKVYKVLAEDGTQIAEIAKEYLNDQNNAAANIDMVAAVVYMMGENGKADLSNGYIAQVYKLNTGEMPYLYREPDFNEEIYGGTISWSERDNCIATYTKGTLKAAPEKLYIPGDDNSLTVEELSNVVEANVVADVVEDNRPNDTPRTYSVVKVGTQYWLGENLKAKCFIDGTQISCGTTDDWGAAQKPLVAATSLSYTIYLDVWNDAENAEAIEAEIDKHGCIYNGFCINNMSVVGDYPATLEGATSFIQATMQVGPLDPAGNALAPEGWLVPTKDETQALYNYVVDNTSYAGLQNVPESNPTRTTRLRKIIDVSNVMNDPNNTSGVDLTLPWAMDQNITGLALCPNACLTKGAKYKDPFASNQNMLFHTRNLLHNTTGNNTNPYSAFVMWGNYQGGINKNYFAIFYGTPIRCIRK